MKRSIFLFGLISLASLAVIAYGQWQVQPQIDPRVGPIYPVNPSYNFQSRSNYDPYQFNWASGRWDYMPIPNKPSSDLPQEPAPAPVRPNWNVASPGIYGPGQSASPPPVSPPPIPPAAPSNAPPPTPDDSSLWLVPATRPDEKVVSPHVVQFEGRVLAVKAVDFAGEPSPHLLLRIRNTAGAIGTIDVGQRLQIPQAAFDPGVKGYITATGQLGILDGHLLLFANKITFGSQTIEIMRDVVNPPK
jgi:hypothetical protein